MSTGKSSLRGRVKQRLKPIYNSGRRLVARRLFSYTPEELESSLRSLGLSAGDTVLVHSGFRRDSGFTATPSEIIERLLNVIGANGHLLMMSIPYRGSSQAYAERGLLFDVARTPSAVGLISEVFRRRDGVVRSLNPLHPILALGPLALWLTIDHDKSLYSCSKGSPFERFLSLDGKFLFLDAPYSSLTFMHYVEDLFVDALPVALYDAEPVALQVKDSAGRELTVRQRCFSQAARAHRDFARVEQRLLREGLLRQTRLGRSSLLFVSARAVVDCARQLVEEGTGFYR